jgi:translation elongation factor EF-G
MAQAMTLTRRFLLLRLQVVLLFREAMNKASPKLLEPVMKVEVLDP